MAIWLKDGKVIVDQNDHIISCDTCPCIKNNLFVDLIQIQSQFRSHNASFWPESNNWYDIQYTLNYFWTEDYEPARSYFSAKTVMIPQWEWFSVENRVYQQIVPLNAARQVEINVFKNFSKLHLDRYVSGTEDIDYSPNFNECLSTSLEIPNNNSYYYYLSSISFSNTDEIKLNSVQSSSIAVFGPSTNIGDGSHYYYYFAEQNYGEDWKPYNAKLFDEKEYYVTRIMTGDNTAYCFMDDQPYGKWYSQRYAIYMTDLFLYATDCGGTSRTYAAGDYIYIGEDDNYRKYYLINQNNKYYYYDDESKLIHQFTGTVIACQLVTSGWSNEYGITSTPYYTGLAFMYKGDVQYLYTKPSSVYMSGHSYNKITVHSLNEPIENGYTINYNGSLYPLEWSSRSGWYFNEHVFENPNDNNTITINSTSPTPPASWTNNGNQYTISAMEYIRSYNTSDNFEQAVPVQTSTGYYISYEGDHYPLQYIAGSGWCFEEYEDDWHILTGYTNSQIPPQYYFWENDDESYTQLSFINYGFYFKPFDSYHHEWAYNVCIPIEPKYDKIFGNLINTYTPIYDNFYSNRSDVNKKIIKQKFLHRNMSPFINFNLIRYDWGTNNNYSTTLKVNDFLSQTYLISKTTNTWLITNYRDFGEEFLFEFGHDDGYNDNMGLATFKLTKANVSTIASNWYNWYSNELSSVLNSLKGVYCQILTGLWIKPQGLQGTTNEFEYQWRQNGFIYQTLEFDKEYLFNKGWLKTSNVYDQLSSDEFTTYLNKIKTKGTKYNSFSANFLNNRTLSAFLNGNSSTAGVAAYQMVYFVRPISGVLTLDANNNDGHLNNLAPATLTSQTK